MLVNFVLQVRRIVFFCTWIGAIPQLGFGAAKRERRVAGRLTLSGATWLT